MCDDKIIFMHALINAFYHQNIYSVPLLIHKRKQERPTATASALIRQLNETQPEADVDEYPSSSEETICLSTKSICISLGNSSIINLIRTAPARLAKIYLYCAIKGLTIESNITNGILIIDIRSCTSSEACRTNLSESQISPHKYHFDSKLEIFCLAINDFKKYSDFLV
ncbi:hypothetical protein BpHYR1_010301 [Brachionus plicatilis]|uniref:Uncharacterized protein n=1 Tax=Brachionus plicatilis TaxID=10195 RepID=A0A3M7Q9K9_BRAPC|nr:hypothetical protein BpHYR1_010301 [Brachionus plicatilis]